MSRSSCTRTYGSSDLSSEGKGRGYVVCRNVLNGGDDVGESDDDVIIRAGTLLLVDKAFAIGDLRTFQQKVEVEVDSLAATVKDAAGSN